MTEPAPLPGPAGTLPDVSVIIPAYGVAPYIGEALASVVAQTTMSWEAIVVNDGSPDTPELEQALAPFRDRISYHRQANQGAAAARNTAIGMARGHWLAFLDGDDRWLPTYLQRQLEVAEARGLDLVWSNGYAIASTGERRAELMQSMPCRGPVTVAALLRADVNVFTSATLARRDQVVAAGGFTEALARAQDFDLWVRLVHSGARAGYHTEPLVEYRSREGSLSGDALSKAERARGVMRHLEREVAFKPEDHQVLLARIIQLDAARLVLLGKARLVAREYKAAVECFRQASSLCPSTKLSLMRAMLAVSPAAARRAYLARHPDGAT